MPQSVECLPAGASWLPAPLQPRRSPHGVTAEVLLLAVDGMNDYAVRRAWPAAKTPNLDRFGESAMTVSRACCASPACVPARGGAIAACLFPLPHHIQASGRFGSTRNRSLTVSAQGRTEIASGPGKSLGTACVTLPVAAHSAPRCSVTMKPTQCIASGE